MVLYNHHRRKIIVKNLHIEKTVERNTFLPGVPFLRIYPDVRIFENFKSNKLSGVGKFHLRGESTLKSKSYRLPSLLFFCWNQLDIMFRSWICTFVLVLPYFFAKMDKFNVKKAYK